MADVKVDMLNDIAPKVTVIVRIVGLKKWYIRLWVAKQLIRLASVITNMGVKFEEKPYYGADL